MIVIFNAINEITFEIAQFGDNTRVPFEASSALLWRPFEIFLVDNNYT